MTTDTKTKAKVAILGTLAATTVATGGSIFAVIYLVCKAITNILKLNQ